jgi:N-acetylneuraminic acid mutarotase
MNKHSAIIILGRRTSVFATVLSCCLGHHLNSALAAPGCWTNRAPMPMAFGAHAGCEVDGIFYVAGGDSGTNLASATQLPTLFAYDPKTDSWTRKADMPTPRRFPAAAVVDGIIYVMGGGGVVSPATAAVEAYDPKTDRWTTKTAMPVPRCVHAACALNGLIYAIGGAIVVGGSPVLVSTVEVYDPKQDQWTQKANLPLEGYGGVALPVNGLIYAFYGKNAFAYNPEGNYWTTKAPIPDWSLNCRLSASSVAEGIVYLFGGESPDRHTTYDFTLAYDPVHDTFTAKQSMPIPCMAAAAVTIDGMIYVAGGVSRDPGVYSTIVCYDSLWVFDPQLLRVNLVKAVKPSFSNLSVGTNYQMQISKDLTTWTNYGSPFTATNASMVCPDYFDVENWEQLYFRLY